MRAVGWVVVPSIWWENSPVVIQEARRAGTPLIVSDIGGMAEKTLPEVDGLHFKRGSPVDLARTMLDAAQPARRAALGATVRDSLGRAEFLAGLDHAFGARRAARAAAA
jgi:glycosyltransferase involved in cell wall biosynthesis